MARAKVILIDADVISHFFVNNCLEILHTILSPHHLFIVDNVYNEATNPSLGTNRKETIDQWIATNKIKRIPFPKSNPNIYKEFYRLKKEMPCLDEGERACVAMARFGQETIASSNFRDIEEYCEEFGIEYIGSMDILNIAYRRGIMSETECDQFIAEAKRINHARLPKDHIRDYTPTRNLDVFCIPIP